MSEIRRTLLLADDSITVQRVVELTFASENIDVIVAGTGAQAIARIESERPDIVLADIGAPEPDGYAIAAFVKGHPDLSGIPVVLLSSALEPVDGEQLRHAACDGVIAKPFEPEAIVSLVRALLARQQQAASGVPRAAEEDSGGAPTAEGDAARPAEPDPLEAYFDRLDAAFATYTARAADRSGRAEEDAFAHAAVASDARRNEGDAAPAAAADARAAPAPQWQPSFTDAFAAMFAPEAEGPRAAPPVPEELIDEIARRVAAKLDEGPMRRLVIETAERIVREEIERIKQASRSGSTPPAG